MGEGLGAGGHATRRQTSQRVCRRFVPTGCKKFFVHGGTSPIAKLARTRHLRCALRDRGRSFGIDATGPAAAKPRRGKGAPSRRRQWQVHMPAVGKFEIARRHSQAPACAAAAFDDVAACPREIDWAGDRFASLLNSFEPPRLLQATSTARSMTCERQPFREPAQGAVNVVDSCGKTGNPSPAQVGYFRLGPT